MSKTMTVVDIDIADLGDANDQEVWKICCVDHYEDPRQKVLRMARERKIPSATLDGKVWFHKPTLRKLMGPRRAQFAAQLTGRVLAMEETGRK